MIHKSLILIMVLLILLFSGCKKNETDPEHVIVKYQELLSSLDEDRAGESINKLKEFEKKYANYEISKTASEKQADLANKVKDNYLIGRTLAREEKFDRAEQILGDISRHFPLTPYGQ